MTERIDEVVTGIRRVLAPNPSMMTGPGTNTYLLGDSEQAVIDPGPVIEEHLERIQSLAPNIRWVLVTHTHPDHSPGAALLAAATGAELVGMPPPDGAHQDQSFRADRILADGDVVETDEFRLTAVHTPGHASNHICYLHAGSNALLTGDHVIDGSTVVINPPDGNMRDYIESLRRVKALQPDHLLPGHGDRIDDPARVIDWIISHRLAREEKVVKALRGHPSSTAAELVPIVYTDVPRHLFGWAERSLLAHLIKLDEEGRAQLAGEHFTLVS